MAHNEYAETKLNVQLMELKEYGETAPTLSLSGGLFLSGGNLFFLSSSGSCTQLAVV